jgi:HTH domain
VRRKVDKSGKQGMYPVAESRLCVERGRSRAPQQADPDCGRTLSATAGRLVPDRRARPMSETLARLLRLLSLRQAHREWSGAELADRLGVTPRTVQADRRGQLPAPHRGGRSGPSGGPCDAHGLRLRSRRAAGVDRRDQDRPGPAVPGARPNRAALVRLSTRCVRYASGCGRLSRSDGVDIVSKR